MGREEELAVARRALTGDVAGIVISGAPGIGKTRVADELTAELAKNGAQVLRILATRAAATIPFGAAATLLDSLLDTVADTRRPLVVGADNAHLLDDATAQLLYRLAAAGHARLVLTVRRAEPAPAPIDALRNDGLCHHVELQPLQRGEVAALLEAALDGQVERHSADNLWRVTAGNVLFLRELCRDALDRGTLRHRHGAWTWTGGPMLGARLQELLDARVGGLGGAERDAAALLALGEPLPRRVLVELASEDAVHDLIRRGLATEDGRNGASEGLVRLSHPLYAEGLRGRLGPLETTDLYARLARELAAGRSTAPDDRLRIAVWSITSGQSVEPGVLVGAAREALARGDAALAEQLARRTSEDPQGALVLGEALATLRRGPEAERVLAALAAREDGATHLAIPVARLAAHRSPDLPLAAARRLAEEALSTLDEPGERDLVDAALADTLCDRGHVASAGVLAFPLLRSPNPAARAMALGPASTWLVGAGRSEEAAAAGRVALADAVAHRQQVPWAPGVVVGHLGTALLSTGRLDELALLCDTARTDAALSPIGRADGSVALMEGAAALLRGRPVAARRALREAVLSFERADAVGRHRRALALLAEADALLGDLESAERALATMPSDDRYTDYDRQRAELCVLAARGHAGAAARRAVELADDARARGVPFFELAMTYTAMRFGAVDVAGRVTMVAALVQGAIAEAFGAHAAALAGDDGPEIEVAAKRLAELGCQLLAAEAMVHAASTYQKVGLTGRARAASAEADALRVNCDGARTPLLAQGAILAGLTRREREIALLAAGGITSREIGEQLRISVRTVDNQLGRIYAKLSLAGRAELTKLVGRLST